MDGAAAGATPVVHEGSWWLLGLGLFVFAVLFVLLAGVLTRLYLADEVGTHRALRVAGRPAPRGPRVAGRRRAGDVRPLPTGPL